MTAAAAEFLALQSAVAGRFSLSHEIGRGGMGVVFLAQDVLLERPVAIKMLAPHLAARAEMRRRFLREARIAAQCFHPHIVPIHSVEEAGDVAHFVMAHVRGETLAERLERAGPLPADDIRRIAREVGWALAYAHERGVIHRDVKPENILLEDGTSRALIADFGIAVHDDPTRTPASGEVAGTARFMAPEQALGEPIDGRADLYALGVTLHLAATGRYPFDANSSVALLTEQMRMPAPAIHTRTPSLPPSIADAIDRCLALRPTDRFASVAQFVAALQPSADETPEPVALRRLRESADSALVLWGWAQIFQFTTRVFIWGEPSTFGAAIIEALGTGIAIMTLVAAFWRTFEGATFFRRAVREGRSRREIASALAGSAPAGETGDRVSGSSRAQGAALAAIGVGLAYAQGAISGLATSGSWSEFLQVVLLVLPPLLVGRGIATAFRRSRVSRWLQDRVRTPLAAFVTRRVGALRVGTAGTVDRSFIGHAHTELRLESAAEQLFARLPGDVRRSLENIPVAAAGLAREANACRARHAELAREEATARRLPADQRDEALVRIAGESAAALARMSTAIAALEVIRLDLMRLDAGDTSGSVTMALDVVHELQRRVDAAADVRALLADRRPEPTPA